LTRLGDPRAALDHGREQLLEVVRPTVTVELGDILAGERRRGPHRERQHLIEPSAGAIARPAEADPTIEPRLRHAEHRGGDRARRRSAEPHDADPANAGGGGDRRDRVVGRFVERFVAGPGHSAAAGTTRMWRSSPSPSLRLDSPGISAIAMWT